MSDSENGIPVEYRAIPGRPYLLAGSDTSIWRRVKPTIKGEDGYHVVGIRDGHGRGSKTHVLYVHNLMLEAFVGPRPAPGMECRHLDGDPGNNSLDNLRWGTPAENTADKARHGTQPRGSRTPNAKLTEDNIPEIRRLIAEGMAQDAIGRRFGVARSTIEGVAIGKTWGHVPSGQAPAAPMSLCSYCGREIPADANDPDPICGHCAPG